MVEVIIDSKIVGKGKTKSRLWLVKWKGYPDSEDSWEPEANLTNAQEAIDDWYKAHPRAHRL